MTSIYPVSLTKEGCRTYKKFNKYALATTATVFVTGLAGLVANHFIGPDSSESLKAVLSNSKPMAYLGGILTFAAGMDYFMNRDLGKPIKRSR